jgi:hypothetical protein
MKKLTIFSFFVLVSTANFFACTSNIQHVQSVETAVVKQKTYNTPFEKVWNATQRALSENETFKVLDKSSKIMVTEFRTVDSKELSLVQTYFLGKTYKSSYTVNFIQHSIGKTDVRVNVKLQAVQVVLLAREESNENVEAYLRKNIFDKIESNLSLGRTTLSDKNSSIKNENIIAPEMTIAEMQQRLLDLGYQAGPADGIAGNRTIAALKKFQRDNNLPVTGRLNNETISNLRK